MTSAPNFLFIMVDQLCAHWLGCYGHPVVKTPNIDALATRGVMCTDFHVATPVCMPNRASFMTGRYPTTHGLRYNGCNLPVRANTFVDALAAGGYKTASIGKSHLQPFTNTPPLYRARFDEGPIAEAWKDEPGYYGAEEPGRYDADGRYEFPTPYYGFNYVDMVTGHGDKAGGHYQQWFRETHSNWRELTDPANELPHDYTCRQAFRTPIPEDSYPTAYIRDRAREYLKENAGSQAPLFTYVSFPDPHHPFNPPGKYWDMYSPEQFELRVACDDHKNPPLPLVDAKKAFDSDTQPTQPTTAFMASEQHVKEIMALTAGMITMIDDAVGEIIDVLKETGQFDNTVIIFNADHGDYMGDFNLMLKGAWLKESLTRVPMIWADPAKPGGCVRENLASTVDLAPTLLARAGIKPYYGLQGESLLPMFESNREIRASQLIEYNDGIARMGFKTPARVRVVVTGEWYLAVYHGEEWGEMYDRANDPYHQQNLWDEANAQDMKLELLQSLSDHLIGLMDESPRALRLA